MAYATNLGLRVVSTVVIGHLQVLGPITRVPFFLCIFRFRGIWAYPRSWHVGAMGLPKFGIHSLPKASITVPGMCENHTLRLPARSSWTRGYCKPPRAAHPQEHPWALADSASAVCPVGRSMPTMSTGAESLCNGVALSTSAKIRGVIMPALILRMKWS